MTVKCSSVLTSLAACLAVACNPANGGKKADVADDHLTCAALLGAADRLMVSGSLPADFMDRGQSLEAAMRHLAAWAIPKQMKESDAFDAVNKERDRLLETESSAEIGRRAKACLTEEGPEGR
jgi:hypothetical protein